MTKDQKLPMMYLANDLVQNSRKKYPEVSKEFGTVMKAVFVHLAALEFDSKTQQSVNRLVNIWRERQSFEKKVLSDILAAWEARSGKIDSTNEKRDSKSCKEDSESVRKKHKSSPQHEQSNGKIYSMEESEACMLEALQDLKSASDPEALEELLSSFPDLSSIINAEEELSEAETHAKLEQVSTVESQLLQQRKVISEEIEKRKQLERIMSQFIVAQRKLIDKKKERLKRCDSKLQSVEEAKSQLEGQLLNAALVDDELDAIPMPEKLSTEATEEPSATNNEELEAIPLPEGS